MQTLFHAQNGLKYGVKLLSGCVCRLYIKHARISCLDLGPNPKVSRYIYAKI